MQDRSGAEQALFDEAETTVAEQEPTAGSSEAEPGQRRRKRVHPSLPGRYRALKRSHRLFKLGFGIALGLCVLLLMLLAHVTRADRTEIRQLSFEVEALRHDLRETGSRQ